MQLKPEVQSLCDELRRFLAKEVDPRAMEIEASDAIPADLHQKARDLGLFGLTIPEQYGGIGLDLAGKCAIEEVMGLTHYGFATVIGNHTGISSTGIVALGNEAQKQKYLPRIAAGELRMQSMAVTEPTTGTDTTKLKTTATRRGNHFVLNGQKVWTSRVQHSDLMIVLARTTPIDQVRKKSEGLSVFLVDIAEAMNKGMTVRPIRNMVNHETNEVFFDDLEVPAENMIGEENKGFRIILEGLNAERVLIAAECIGDAYWFIDKASAYGKERIVFDRPIGQNQGIQFPIAKSHIATKAADAIRYQAAALHDAGLPYGTEANMAKMLCSDASWEAANACLQTHGGFGFAAEYDVERKFRETRLYQVAPISTNLILAYVGEHVLGLPRSY